MNARWVRGPPAPESTGDGDYSNEVDRCEAPVRRSGEDGVTGGAGRRGRPRPRPGRRIRATVCKVCHSAHRTHPPTVCNLCHSGRGPDLHRMRPTVCKVCHSTRRARPPYGVQPVPFRVRPGLLRDAPDGVQGVQSGTPDPPPIRCATCAIPGAAGTAAGCARRCARCAMRRAAPAPHTVCNLCHSGRGPDFHEMRPTVCKVCNAARRTRPPYGVQGVPFRVWPGLPRDAPDGVQGVQCGALGRDWRLATGHRP